MSTPIYLNGTTLAYTRSGAGTPLLCLHGGMGLDSTSLRMGGILNLAAAGCDLVLFDQRGHGQSDAASESSYTHEIWARDAAELVRFFGWKQYALLGPSYGGFIALEHAVRWPLILVATSAGPVPASSVSFESTDALRGYFQRLWPHFFVGDAKHWALFEQLHFSADPFNAAFTHALPRYNLRAKVRGLATPILLIVGSRGPYLEAMTWLAHQLPLSELYVLDEVGHFPYIEAEATFLSLVTRFLGVRRAC